MKLQLRFAILTLIFCCQILSIGCTRASSNTTLKVQLPNGASSQSSVSALSTSTWNSALDPSALSQFNCYAVFVGGPEPQMNKNNCYDSAGTVKFNFGPFLAFAPAGSQISIDVPSGPNRNIILVGLQSQNGACVKIPPNTDPDKANMSEPFILGSIQKTLAPGTQNVTIVRNFVATNYFKDCNISSNGGAGPSSLLYGDGADGSHTIGANIADVSSDTTVFGGRNFSAAARVTNIDSSTGTIITTYLPPTASQFQTGDEVMWMVMGAHDTGGGGGPDGVCGSGNTNVFPRGKYGFANVVSTSASTITLDYPVTGSPGQINNAALGNTSPPYDISNASSFCFIQIVRVPNFDTLTVSAASIGVTPFTYVNGYGGIIAFRVKTALVQTLATTFSVSAKGFQGTTSYYQGDGLEGQGQGNNQNPWSNAGGSSTTYGGGGGSNSGQGANGIGGTPGLGGMITNFCGGSTICSPIMKAFFGGAGGSAQAAAAGGAGGGIIFVFANQTSGAYPLTFDATGAVGPGGPSGNGGGAGGSILYFSNTMFTTAATTFKADGGNGGAATNTGGGGGGGSIFAHTCVAPGGALSYTKSNGTGGTGATVGLLDNNLNDANACGP